MKEKLYDWLVDKVLRLADWLSEPVGTEAMIDGEPIQDEPKRGGGAVTPSRA